jgi:Na+/proline symporter
MFDFKDLRIIFGIFTAAGCALGIIALALQNFKVGMISIALIAMTGIPLLLVLLTLSWDKKTKKEEK